MSTVKIPKFGDDAKKLIEEKEAAEKFLEE
jgi:hypothetical protein